MGMKILPVLTIAKQTKKSFEEKQKYFIDERLVELRKCNNPTDVISFETRSELTTFLLAAITSGCKLTPSKELVTEKDASEYADLINGIW